MNFTVKKIQGGINSEFNDAVERVRTSVTDTKWSFGRWCGYLKGIPAHKIHEFIGSAKQSDNVGRKFFWLVKSYRASDK